MLFLLKRKDLIERFHFGIENKNASILNRTNKKELQKVQNLYTNWSLSQQPELGMGRLCIYFSMREYYDPSNVTPLGETDLM